MLKLILLRHGKAANPESGQEDYDRPLNRKGIVQINQIGHHLSTVCDIEQIISSSAKRTFETSQIVNHYLQLKAVDFNKSLYLANEEQILTEIKSRAKKDQILYVGHNFGISNLASLLGGNSISMTTGMMVSFNFAATNWEDIQFGKGQIDLVRAPNVFIP